MTEASIRPVSETGIRQLIKEYEQAGAADSESAALLRQKFLNMMQRRPGLLAEEEFSRFLASAIEPEDIAALEWESTGQMLQFQDSLHRSRYVDEDLAHRLHQHTSQLLRQALYQFEKNGAMEQMVRLLRLAPAYLLRQDDELSRLHYRANAYEIRRVRRNRRWLYGYLVLQVILVLIVFPLLFINAENGRLQRQVEELANVELGDEGYQLLSYSEGLYWAVVTASSIGYGDITPRTNTGRFIAGALGTMGVITVGILAGLVLDWITPRRL
ncbi:MAG: two pore domain potassium channel family protein [Anaerolineales bacterium]|nr:two pore domain potassium channel family protein [Anaerolineales bacterium]